MKSEQIVAKAIRFLKDQDLEITPEAFSKAFCREMKKEGFYHEECDRLERFIARLDEGYQKLIKNYAPKNINELVQFLISQVNRLNPTEASEYLTAQYILIVKILRVVKELRHKEIAKLASTTLDKLENTRNSELLFGLAREWDSMGANYKPTEFEPVKSILAFKSHYLDDLAIELESFLDRGNRNLEGLVSAVADGLKPSFSQDEAEFELFKKSLQNNPSALFQKKTQGELGRMVSKRVFLDNEAIREKIFELDDMLDGYYKDFSSSMEISEQGSEKVDSIKKLIEDSNEGDFDSFRLKLSALVTALGVDMDQAALTLKSGLSQMKSLKLEVKILESELENAKLEARTDFLTQIANRKTLDEEMEWLEELYLSSDSNYSVIIFEIDRFKEINDLYGHLAGDVALTSFAQIMKKKFRDTDIIGRFGGEVFMAILPKTDANEAKNYAEEVRVAIEATRFVYKENRIIVTASVGLAERKNTLSIKELIKAADFELHNAKETGGNKVYPI